MMLVQGYKPERTSIPVFSIPDGGLKKNRNLVHLHCDLPLFLGGPRQHEKPGNWGEDVAGGCRPARNQQEQGIFSRKTEWAQGTGTRDKETCALCPHLATSFLRDAVGCQFPTVRAEEQLDHASPCSRSLGLLDAGGSPMEGPHCTVQNADSRAVKYRPTRDRRRGGGE